VACSARLLVRGSGEASASSREASR
jgi:hypothetical protein